MTTLWWETPWCVLLEYIKLCTRFHEILIKKYVVNIYAYVNKATHTHTQNILCSLLYCILTTKIQIGESFDLSKKLKFWTVKKSKTSGHAEHKWTPNTFDFSCQLKPTTQYFHPHTVIKTKTKTNKKNSHRVRSYTPGISKWVIFLFKSSSLVHSCEVFHL